MSFHRIKVPALPREQAVTVCCNTDGPTVARVAISAGTEGLNFTMAMTPDRARLVADALYEMAGLAAADRAKRAPTGKAAA